MAINNIDALLETVGPLMGTTWEQLTAENREASANQALMELGWSLPETDARKCYWIIERTKRYSLYVLLIQFASKFRYKQIHLQQKFENHLKLIQAADETYAKAMEEDITGMFDVPADLESFANYGFLMNPAGFVYDSLGRDLTYAD